MPTVQLLFVNKSSQGPGIPTEEVMRIFETEADLDKIKTAVEQSSERLYVSWANVDVEDNANERITIEEMAGNQDTLLERNGPITDEHTNRVVGQTLGYKIMQHPTEALGVLHLNKIYDHNARDDQVWKEIVSGERKGSSVGGFNENDHFEMSDQGTPVRVLEGFNHMETASVFEPCNPLALNEAISVVAKSAKAIKTEEPAENAEKGASVIKKEHQEEVQEDISKKNGVDMTMDEDVTKAFEAVNKNLTEIRELVTKADEEEEKKPKEEEKEAKKADEEEKKPEEEKEAKKAAEESTDGGVNLAGADKPEDERPEEENQLAVVKAKLASIEKENSELKKKLTPVTKTETSRPTEPEKDVKKNTLPDAGAIAKGEVKKSRFELESDIKKAMEGSQ